MTSHLTRLLFSLFLGFFVFSIATESYALGGRRHHEKDHHGNGKHGKHEGSHTHEGSYTKKVPIRLQKECPVSYKSVSKEVFSDYQGKRVYFHDAAAKNIFLANPEKYVEKIQSQGITLAHKQVLCPVSGDPILEDEFLEYQGKKIYLCCKMCKKMFLKDPDQYIQAMEAQGVILEDASSSAYDPREKSSPSEGSHNHHEGSHSR